jgi:hypothetical protein
LIGRVNLGDRGILLQSGSFRLQHGISV